MGRAVVLVSGKVKNRPKDLFVEGKKLAEKRDFKAAMYKMRQTIAADPKFEDAYLWLGTMLIETDRGDEAEEIYRKGVKAIPQSVEMNCMAGLCSNASGEFGEAFERFTFVLSKEPDNPDALRGIGSTYLNTGEFELAKDALEKSLALHDSSLAHLDLARVLRALGDEERALTEVEFCLAINPEDSDAYREKGQILHLQGDGEGALFAYKQSLELDPNDPQTLNSLAAFLVNYGQAEVGLKMFEEALELYPNDYALSIDYASALVESGRIEEGRANLERLSQLYLDDVVIKKQIGRSMFLSGDAEGAAQIYRECIEQDPDYADAHGELGTYYGATGQADLAVQEFSKAIELAPWNSVFKLRLAELLEATPQT